MPSIKQMLISSAILAVASAQGVLVSAKGDKGTSPGLQVDSTNPEDANFISQAEIEANVVNECGRTLHGGNIDIGANTEDQLAAGNVTSVTAGSDVAVTINQVNATGAGPYTCDMDPTNNSQGNSGQTPLTVKERKSNGAAGNLALTVSMPNDLACTGSSTANICTIRCKNAQNFGGCFVVQQTDTAPDENSANTIQTAQTLEGITDQIAQNQKDLPAATKAIAESSLDLNDQGKSLAEEILAADPVVEDAATVASSSAATTATAKANTGQKGKGNGAANGNAATDGNAASNKNGRGNGATAATNGNGNSRGNGNGRGNNNKRTLSVLR
ncbi:GEgh16 protein [Amylocarpus encephaloides]|uniref:GEgh16 protein n=1 Tax=Amylocarpus encephaloides TaxID=45428 RepID=A0A9P8C2I4_9HELO|nr:GEgh16 protein [Amylocarpus encephaloides]